MNINFTKHAKQRLRKRNVLEIEVKEALLQPDKTVKRHGKYYIIIKINMGKLEVVCEKKGKNLNIITLYWI